MLHVLAAASSATSAAGDQGGVPWWVPVVTLVLGAMVTLGVETIRSRDARADRQQAATERRADRAAEREALDRERGQRLADEHRRQQRDSLTELQEAMSSYIRLIGRGHHHDVMAWRAAGEPAEYPVDMLPEGLSEEINVVERRVQVLSQRVDDAEVRDGVREVVVCGLGAIPARKVGDAGSANAALGRMVTAFSTLNERIGSILRGLPND